MKFLSLTWNDVEEAVIELAERVEEAGERVDVVVGVMRGGWIVARLIADLLGVRDIGALEVKFYRGIQGRSERPVIVQPLLLDVRDRNVMIVDDVADTGKSLQVAVNAVNLYGPKTTKTLTLYVKPWSIIVPDFYYASTDRWIIFPWEPREIIEELVRAEYKAFPRSLEELEAIAAEIAATTGIDVKRVAKILALIASSRDVGRSALK
ncbi:MAG: phosphoribosyltransferase [Fervidicoccaceae archaeon]